MSKFAAKEWLKAAEDDMLLVSKIIEDERLTNLAAFHCQQAVEKILKAAIEFNGLEAPRKHDLVTLKSRLSGFLEIGQIELLEELNSLYIDARYPSELGILPDGKPSISKVKVFFELSENLYGKVKTILNSGAY